MKKPLAAGLMYNFILFAEFTVFPKSVRINCRVFFVVCGYRRWVSGKGYWKSLWNIKVGRHMYRISIYMWLFPPLLYLLYTNKYYITKYVEEKRNPFLLLIAKIQKGQTVIIHHSCILPGALGWPDYFFHSFKNKKTILFTWIFPECISNGAIQIHRKGIKKGVHDSEKIIHKEHFFGKFTKLHF